MRFSSERTGGKGNEKNKNKIKTVARQRQRYCTSPRTPGAIFYFLPFCHQYKWFMVSTRWSPPQRHSPRGVSAAHRLLHAREHRSDACVRLSDVGHPLSNYTPLVGRDLSPL